jgi:hypothetical protein
MSGSVELYTWQYGDPEVGDAEGDRDGEGITGGLDVAPGEGDALAVSLDDGDALGEADADTLGDGDTDGD